MQIHIHPQQSDWSSLSKRPAFERYQLDDVVTQILNKVKIDGDAALFEYADRFDNVKLNKLSVSEKEFEEALDLISDDLKQAVKLAEKNIETFHAAQQIEEDRVEVSPGVLCWRKSLPIEKVGLYVPGGTAPLFSTVLMLAVPARIAGSREIVLCTPPDKNGKIHPAVLYTANLCGITKVFKVGGAQAVAAMAYGTESVPAVYKIFGPGNQFVTKAKEMIQQQGVAIDMPAGPSEVLIIADETSVPEFVAADLLSQAEHGTDSQVILLSDSEKVIERSLAEMRKQLRELPRKAFAEVALSHSRSIVLSTLEECFKFSNLYAPEHLIIASENAGTYLGLITNAGSVFVGNYSCESAGDYASGTNHTLPTNGYARNYSGVSLDSFMKKVSFQELTAEGINTIGSAIEIMAETEQLHAHKNAVTLRLRK